VAQFYASFEVYAMNKTIKILIGLAVVISLLIILPFLIPVQTYLREAETRARVELGVPVTIASGHFSLLPSPRVIVNKITVGENEEIKLEQLAVIPKLSSIFSATKAIDLYVSQPTVNQSALALVSALAAKSAPSNDVAAINIRHIEVKDLQLDGTGLKLPLLNIDAKLSWNNQLESTNIVTQDGKLNATVTSKDGGYSILLGAEQWILPATLPLLIDSAKLEMYFKAGRLQLPTIDIALYGGKLTGNAELLMDKKWRANGKLKVENLSLKAPTSLVNKSTNLSGKLFGQGNFLAQAKNGSELLANLRADFNFTVNDGVLNGLDLVKAASIFIKQGQRGGETEFEEFAGELNVNNASTAKQYHLREIKLRSGLLAASGQIKVSANEDLDGIVEVELKHSVSLVAIPLQVSGTLSQPVVLPSTAAMAGAVAGTAILGPGLGTGLGVKAGGAIDKIKGLFGSD
jgi:uncharacterized protein involved in outer membrane biogenesis